MPSNPKKGKTSAIKCTENLKEFYENEDEFKFSEGKLCLEFLENHSISICIWYKKDFLI